MGFFVTSVQEAGNEGWVKPAGQRTPRSAVGWGQRVPALSPVTGCPVRPCWGGCGSPCGPRGWQRPVKPPVLLLIFLPLECAGLQEVPGCLRAPAGP